MTAPNTDIAPFMKGYISGCSMSLHPVYPNVIVIDGGVLTSDDGFGVFVFPSGSIDFSTVGAGGLDTGSISSSQWYHCFAIAKDDGTTSYIASSSLTAPVLPAGYTRKRRIGSQRINSSLQLKKLHQRGNDFFWDVPVNDYVGNNPGTSDISTTLSVPSDVVVKASFYYYLQSSAGGRRSAFISSPTQSPVTPSSGVMSSITAGMASDTGVCNGQFEIWTNSSSQIRHRLDGSSSGTSVFIVTNGWFDPL